MRLFSENKWTVTAVLSLFALAFAVADHGPTMPPNPWDGLAAVRSSDHGPTMPPNPWDGLADHGPTMPPNPWDGIC
jgi:hypothetical protein